MDTVFNETTTTVETTAPSNEKKEKIQQMKAALMTTIQTNPEFAQNLRRLSNSVKVTNTLGFGDDGNIVVDKNAKAEGRVLAPTSQIVGYRVQNTGSEAIKYQTEVWAKGEDGKYVGSVVEKTLAPGESVDLSRKWMTAFCVIPEISFTLANGKIVASSKKKAKSIDEELSSYYFSFDKDAVDEHGAPLQVNDDKVKIRIDVDKVVTDEYVETFGFLNNPKEGKPKAPKGSKFTTQDLAANYINTLLKEQGIK